MDKELRLILYSFIPPVFFTGLLWAIKYMEHLSGFGFSEYGNLPRHIEGLRGIVLSPFIHGSLEHLVSNTIPLLLLGAALIYFYQGLSLKVFGFIWFLSGLGLWLGGREVYHIGASGLVYGLAFFLFVSGILRKDTRLMAISLLVVFLYGSMIWGIFPIWRGVSWEGHLFGSLAGILCAIVFRQEGPQRQVYVWETEQEQEINAEEEVPVEDEEPQPVSEDSEPDKQNNITVHYIYKEKNPKGNETEKN